MIHKRCSNALGVLISLMVLFLLVLPGTASAQTMYVKKSGTKLRASNSAKSDVLAKLKKGTPVTVAKKSRRFYKVSAPGGKSGWIFKFKLTSKAPQRGQGGDFLGALGGQQIAARESASGSSIRGLSPISEKHAKSKGISQKNIDAVKKMENFKVRSEEIEKFLMEGKLGEYGS